MDVALRKTIDGAWRSLVVFVGGRVAERMALADADAATRLRYHEAGHGLLLRLHEHSGVAIAAFPELGGGAAFRGSNAPACIEAAKEEVLNPYEETGSDDWYSSHLAMLLLSVGGVRDDRANVERVLAVAEREARLALEANGRALRAMVGELESTGFLDPEATSSFFAKHRVSAEFCRSGSEHMTALWAFCRESPAFHVM